MKNLHRKLASVALTVTLSVVTLLSFIPAASAYFLDVNPNHKYHEAIIALQNDGIISGYSDAYNGQTQGQTPGQTPGQTFQPESNINRAEFLKILTETYLAEEVKQTSPSNCFPDVKANDWYSSYVCLAKNKSIISGYDNGKFHPEKNINLAEALKIVTKLDSDITVNFANHSPDDPWYKEIIETSKKEGIVPAEFMSADQLVNRGQMAEIIYRSNYTPLIARQTEEFDPLTNASQISKYVKLDLPFTPQAPTQKWSAPFDEACEETSLIMVYHYLNGFPVTKNQAATEIQILTKWVETQGYSVDIGASAIQNLARNFYNTEAKVYTDDDITVSNIKKLLSAGYPVIIPVAGQSLQNNPYKYPGPPYHVFVLTGYNNTHFFAHDPGSSKGSHYQYEQGNLVNSIHDWAGSKDNVLTGGRAMVVLEDKRM